jgi:sulfatase modifying factor 1
MRHLLGITTLCLLLGGCLDRLASEAELDQRIAQHAGFDGLLTDTSADGTDLGGDGSAGSDALAGPDEDSGAPGTDSTVGPDGEPTDDAGDGGTPGGDAFPGLDSAPDTDAGPGQDGGSPSCANDAECFDGDPCTTDSCDGGTCNFPTADNGIGCGEGTVCSAGKCVEKGCGDGLIEAGEDCDDGNTSAGDGCSETCHKEPTPPPGMVYIPPGKFTMGCQVGDPSCEFPDETTHSVTLTKGYFIDEKLVTAAHYKLCVQSLGCGAPDASSGKLATYEVAGKEGFPVNYVSWPQAQAYCVAMGAQLCSEAQWERAARGPGTSLYPWGNTAPTCDKANFQSCGGKLVAAGTLIQGATTAGVLDMAGNVWQWVGDWYGGFTSGPQTDPTGPSVGTFRMLRGGSLEVPAQDLRCSARYEMQPSLANYDIGFRCCKSVVP